MLTPAVLAYHFMTVLWKLICISSGEQLHRKAQPEHWSDPSSTPDQREELYQPNGPHVVDPGVYAAVLDYCGVRIFVKRSAMTSSTTAKVGPQVNVRNRILCHDRTIPCDQRTRMSQ